MVLCKQLFCENEILVFNQTNTLQVVAEHGVNQEFLRDQPGY